MGMIPDAAGAVVRCGNSLAQQGPTGEGDGAALGRQGWERHRTNARTTSTTISPSAGGNGLLPIGGSPVCAARRAARGLHPTAADWSVPWARLSLLVQAPDRQPGAWSPTTAASRRVPGAWCLAGRRGRITRGYRVAHPVPAGPRAYGTTKGVDPFGTTSTTEGTATPASTTGKTGARTTRSTAATASSTRPLRPGKSRSGACGAGEAAGASRNSSRWLVSSRPPSASLQPPSQARPPSSCLP